MIFNRIGLRLLMAASFLLVCSLCFTSCDMSGSEDGATEADAAAALRQALQLGTDTSTKVLSARDGYFADAVVKILLPPEAEPLLNNPLTQPLVDPLVEKLNRAAELAAKRAGPIFYRSITRMTVTDAWSIVNGADTSATYYLKQQTTDSLKAAFQPIVRESLNEVGAIDAWNFIFTTYNSIPFVTPINPNLDEWVTDRALRGLFVKVGDEEKRIRNDINHQVTELLRLIFGDN